MQTVTPPIGHAKHQVEHTAQRAAHSDVVHALGRAGLAARGVIYLLLGLLAARIAIGVPTETADKQGVVVLVADQPLGRLLLVVLAVGMAAYALWEIVRIFQVQEDSDAKAWGKRLAYFGTAALWAGASATAASFVLGQPKGGGGGQDERAWTAEVMGWPGGRLLVGAAGVGFLVFAGWNAYRAVSRKFLEHLETDRMGEDWEKVATASGVAGYLGRGGAFAAVGWFVTQAALDFDPSEPIGLDESLRTLHEAAYGPWVIGFIALGLALFGLYSFVEGLWREQP
ncbi:MAG TPA: DUF1206 domain-containing protein, partial [Acidimicrobiales bacterium]